MARAFLSDKEPEEVWCISYEGSKQKKPGMSRLPIVRPIDDTKKVTAKDQNYVGLILRCCYILSST